MNRGEGYMKFTIIFSRFEILQKAKKNIKYGFVA